MVSWPGLAGSRKFDRQREKSADGSLPVMRDYHDGSSSAGVFAGGLYAKSSRHVRGIEELAAVRERNPGITHSDVIFVFIAVSFIRKCGHTSGGSMSHFGFRSHLVASIIGHLALTRKHVQRQRGESLTVGA